MARPRSLPEVLGRSALGSLWRRAVPRVVRRGVWASWRAVAAIRDLSQYPYHRKRLKDILATHQRPRDVIVFAPSVEWDIALFQRPQQLALALARQGALVFYAEPPHAPTRTGFERLAERLYRARVAPGTFRALDRPVVVVLSWNSRELSRFRRPRVVYDYIDDLAVFPGRPRDLAVAHHDLLVRADTVLATAARLHDEVRRLRPDSLRCPNGVDYPHFATARDDGDPPADLVPLIEEGRPIIGYYGALARWFDYDLLADVARRRRDLSFLLIGPDFDRSLAGHAILHSPNVHWLGARPYAELPAYLRHFDVAMIPFRLEPITHATSPLKLFEYMAAAKPIVITPMEESSAYDGVLVANGAEEFARRLDDALALGDDATYRGRLDQVARANTWDARARVILEALGARPTAHSQK